MIGLFEEVHRTNPSSIICEVMLHTVLTLDKNEIFMTVVIAQWDSSLSVLSVAWVVIAQWDSSLSVLSMAWVMIAQWDSSLSVLPVARVVIAQWIAHCLSSLWPGL